MALKVLAILTVVSVIVWEAEGQVDCTTGDGFQCKNCKEMVFCINGAEAMTVTCSSDQVCADEVENSPTTCYAPSTTGVNSNCKCSGTYPEFLKDPYSDSNYLLCLSSTVSNFLSCPSGQTFDSASDTCQEAPTTLSPAPMTCTGFGVFPDPNTCDGFYVCVADASGEFVPTPTQSCPNGQVWDPFTLLCSADDPITPPNPTCTTDQLLAPDPAQCNAFYVCNGVSVVGTSICCPPNQVFNDNTLVCEDYTGETYCPTTSPCLPSTYTPSCGVPSVLTTSTTSSSTSTTSTSTTSSTTSTSTSTTSSTPSSTSTTTSSTSTSTTTSTPSSTSTTTSTSTSTSTPSSTSTSTSTPSSTSTSTSTPSSTSTSTSTPSSTSTSTSTPSSTSTSTSTTSSTSTSTSTTSSTSTSSTTECCTTVTTTTTLGPPTCTSSNTGTTYEFAGDCKKYYYCYNGNYYVMRCTGSLIYNPNTGLCAFTSDYTCPY